MSATLKSYNRVVYYDPSLDGEAVRIIGYSGHGAYVVTFPLANAGRKRREQLAEALAAISEAIRVGDPPGDVSAARVAAARMQWALDRREQNDR